MTITLQLPLQANQEDSDKAAEYLSLKRLPPLDPSKLESFLRREYLPKEDYSDDKNGILVKVVTREIKPEDCTDDWMDKIERGKKEYFEDGVKWLRSASWSRSRSGWNEKTIETVITMRIRFTPDNVKNLITNLDSPLFARWYALRNIQKSSISQVELLSLIESASRDFFADMRKIAVHKAKELGQESFFCPVLARALCDPCLDVSDSATLPLARYFKFSDEIRDYFFGYGWGTGPPWKHYMQKYSRVAEVSRRVHALNPELVTAADLAVIDSLQEPSEEWWKRNYEDKGFKGRESYERWKKARMKDSEKSDEFEEQ